MYSFKATLFFLLANSILVASAATGVCTQGIYKLLLPLSTYAPAVSYCNANFPRTVTTTTTTTSTSTNVIKSTVVVSTLTATTSTSTTFTTTTTTTGIAVAANRAKRDAAAEPIPIPMPAPAAAAAADPLATLVSSLAALARGVASTACSCIDPPATSTVTSTAVAPTTSTSLTTTTTFTSTSTSIGTSTVVIVSTVAPAAQQGCTASQTDYSGYCYTVVNGFTISSGSSLPTGGSYTSVAICADACASYPTCKYFVYVSSGSSCSLYSSGTVVDGSGSQILGTKQGRDS